MDLQLGQMTSGEEYLKSGMDGNFQNRWSYHTLGRRRGAGMKEKREEIESINPMGESSKTHFSYFHILPQADPEALDVIILARMPGLE